MLDRVNGRSERGMILPASLVLVVVLAIGAATFLRLTSTEIVQAGRSIASVRAFYYAEAGLNYAQSQLLRGWQLATLSDPFYFVDSGTMKSLPAEKVVQAGSTEEGRFRAEIIGVSTPYREARDITVRSTGTYRGENRTVMATFCLELRPSRVFDYGYFVNHSGWMEGLPSTFKMYGNVRANGHFSFYGSSLSLSGNPEYKWVRGEKLYKDCGGIYAGLRVLDASLLNGMGGLAANQSMGEDVNQNCLLDAGEDHNHDGKLTRPERVVMPNLSEMDLYEQYAASWNSGIGGSIKIQGAGQGGTDLVVSDAVYGDADGEKGNLMLWGTQQNPIVVDGPVVVRGALIIKGYVKGKGCIYADDNIYIPDNVEYVNPPVGTPSWNYYAYSTPEERYEAWMLAAAQWRQANADKDALGVFAAENVVIGDFQATSWRASVESWLNNPANENAEGANGLDGIPNTSDQGENDGSWTVDRYTQEDLEKGIMPPGKSVGEAVRGSGEDVDGDGLEDGRICLADFDFPATLDTTSWGGWTPLTQSGSSGPGGRKQTRTERLQRAIDRWLTGTGKSGSRRGRGGQDPGTGTGTVSYSSFLNPNGGDALDHIDAMIYTNHATAANIGRLSAQVHILGGIVSRIGAVIFRNDGSAEWIHDERFTSGGEGLGFTLPRVKGPIRIVHWGEVPSPYAAAGGQ